MTPSKSINTLAPLLIISAAILWGIDGIIRVSLYSLPPIIIVFYEHLIGLLIIAPFCLTYLKKMSLSRSEWLAILWVSLFSGLLGTLWFTQALVMTEFIPFSVVFLLQKLQPLFAMLFAAAVLKEKLTPKYLLWVLPTLIAGYFLTFPQGKIDFNNNQQTVWAAMLAVGAAFAWGSSTAVSRYALQKQSHTLITGLRFAFTSSFALIAVFLFGATEALTAPTLPQYYKLIVIALSTGMVALWIYYKGLKFTPAKVATILELALPITAVLIDVFWFKKTLQLTQYLAAAVMAFSMIKVGQIKDK